MEIKYLVVPEVDPKKVSFSYQLFLDDFVRVYVTSDFRVWTSTSMGTYNYELVKNTVASFGFLGVSDSIRVHTEIIQIF